ncbi:phage tail tube protein [Candidatus Darwinibacter acetoxidans]
MAESTGLKTQFILGANTIGQVASITPPGPTRETVDVEDLNPADEFKKKLIGLIDGGDMSFTINFNPEDAGHKACEAALYSGVEQTCKIKYKSGKGYTFKGYVTGFAPQEITAGDVMQAEVTIAVTSKPTYGAIA